MFPQICPVRIRLGVISLAEVRLQEGESLENALRRFKRKVQTEDIIKEVRRHSYYLKPGEKKRVKQAKEFKDLSSHSYVDFYQFAWVYAVLGDKDETFRLLETGYKEHTAGMVYLGSDVAWYGMRSDPRYADLLRRTGLPQPV